jgi:hypothetical protein
MSTTIIEAYVVHVTEKAVLVSDELMGNIATDQWLPKSQIHIEETKPNGISRIAVAEWLVIKKGLDGLVITEAEDERP